MFFKVVPYEVDPVTRVLNYDTMQKQAVEVRPRLIVAGSSAYPRFWDWERLRSICDGVGAFLMVDIAHIAGLVAAGVHPSPVPFADIVTSTTHKTLRGPRGGLILCPEKYAKEVDKYNFPGTQGGPFMHCIAAKAVCFKEAMTDGFKEYQKQTVANAARLASVIMKRGFDVVSGGTDNHLFLIDLSARGMTGKDAANALNKAGITVNKNTVPFDTQSPFVTSGIRVGTPALTTRGMKEPEMDEIGEMMARILDDPGNEDVIEAVRLEVADLTKRFPLYE
jgi:glycine hydroxymethyltransferase